jgi:uncharacterized membrane protein YhaH (DUF805 family)
MVSYAFRGRTARIPFVLWTFVGPALVLIGTIFLLIPFAVFCGFNATIPGTIGALAVIGAAAAPAARRLHDLGLSAYHLGWYLLIPALLGIVGHLLGTSFLGFAAIGVQAAFFVYLAIAPGEPGSNRYGAPA